MITGRDVHLTVVEVEQAVVAIDADDRDVGPELPDELGRLLADHGAIGARTKPPTRWQLDPDSAERSAGQAPRPECFPQSCTLSTARHEREMLARLRTLA